MINLLKNITVFPTLLLLLLSGCGPSSFSTEEQYYQWINETENGLVKEKFINGTHFKVNLLPEGLLFLKELKQLPGRSNNNIDSIKDQLAHTKTFVITIGPDNREEHVKKSLMKSGIQSYEEYKERLMQLNFGLEELISLKIGDEVMRPVLTNFEEVYELVDHRKINLVFVPADERQAQLMNSEDLELVFEDRIFHTGTNHFYFDKKDIDQTPTVKLNKI